MESFKPEQNTQDISSGNDTESYDETPGWTIVMMIKNGQYKEAKQSLERDSIVLNDEMKETIGWIVVKKVKVGDMESAQAIQDQFNIELNEEMTSIVSMLKNKQEGENSTNEQGVIDRPEVAEGGSDYQEERNRWSTEWEEKQEGEKACPNCGAVTRSYANFCGKCGHAYDDKNSIAPLRSSLTQEQFHYLGDINIIIDDHDISEEEAKARLDKIRKHHEKILSVEEKEDAMEKYKNHFNLE